MNYIYARQSVDKKDSISIETQIEYAKKELMGEEFKVYKDKGFSGKNVNRPAFTQMMSDLETEDVSKIIVYRLDRISRSIVDFADFIKKLEDKNIAFVSSTEKFDTSAPMGKAMLYIVVVFAQLERETIAERIRDNYYSRVKKGGLGGGPAPYGFDIIRKNIKGTMMSAYCPNENIGNVSEIFNQYSNFNSSLADVQRYLNKNKIMTAKNKPWDNSKLSTLLKSPSYVKADLSIYSYYQNKGVVIVNEPEEFTGKKACVLVGKRAPNERKYSDVSNHVLAIADHDGLIESDLFLYVQEKLSKNKQIKNTNKGKHSWLTGIVKCKNCGYSFSVKGKNYFADSGRYLYKVCDVKQTHIITDVEKFVETEIVKKMHNKGVVFNAKNKRNENTELNAKIAEIDYKINNLLMSLENGESIALNYINKRINELDSKKSELLKQQSTTISTQIYNAALKKIDLENLSFADKKNLALMLIDKVYLGKDTVEIVWK